MRLWRISSYPGLTGVGGTFVDGRWHTKPRHVLYVAEHPALAMIEILAHMRLDASKVPLTLRLLAVDILPRARRAKAPALPKGWQANQLATQTLGNQWLDGCGSLMLPVPSAIVTASQNYLINPLHPQAATHLRETDYGPFWIDPRFFVR